jgi:2-C-methyl-D-erythritol 4-phosphate cytidylyltransferase
MFRHGMLMRALRDTAHVTDEAGAVEALGYKARLVEGDTRNLKVTFPSDLRIAEGILADQNR